MMLSIAIPSPHITLKPSLHLHPRLKTNSLFRVSIQTHDQISPLTTSQSLQPIQASRFLGISGKKRFGFSCNRQSSFSLNAKNSGSGESEHNVDEAERLARGESTMPERFRHLTKEAPDPPVRWPWFIALAFLVYAWRAVLFELSNWRKGALTIVAFAGYLLKLILALIFHFIGDPLTSMIFCLETAIYSVRAFYSGIVAYTPIGDLTLIIIFASAVLSIAEATVPNSVSCQPYLLTLSGLIGYAVVGGHISEPFFWTLLLGIYSFSRLIKKRGDVTSALPIATVLAAVGEPWVRAAAMTAYLALAIFYHSKKHGEGKGGVQVLATKRKVPLPLFGAALAIGIRVAAKWAGYRHLTWMIA